MTCMWKDCGESACGAEDRSPRNGGTRLVCKVHARMLRLLGIYIRPLFREDGSQ